MNSVPDSMKNNLENLPDNLKNYIVVINADFYLTFNPFNSTLLFSFYILRKSKISLVVISGKVREKLF